MCGIAGRFSVNGSLSEEDVLDVEHMTEALRHRGPDDGGLLRRTPLAVLGHRRLSIIDVAHGQQPMGSGDGEQWITYNGEIYNYRELRRELESRGHGFRTDSDTEVILAAYRQWGEGCVDRLEGMFAFAVLDLPEERLFLARDHVGKKPLYYRWRRGILDFASELAALRHAADWEGEIDPLGLSFYLRLTYVPSPWTAFRNVGKLRPGESCTVDRNGFRRRRFWEPGIDRLSVPSGLEDVTSEVHGRLRESVRARLMSEVPLGAFLSGGIDSGLVVAMMAELCGPGVRTTSVGFDDDPAGDERGPARAVAERFRTDHAEISVHSEGADLLDRLLEHFGEPFGDASAIPTWSISEATRERVTVALTGDGGDEPFGGYDFRYLPHRRDAALRRLFPAGLRRPAFGTLARIWPLRHSLPRALRLQGLFRNLAIDEDEAFYLDLCFTPPELASRLAPELAPFGQEVEDHVRTVYRSANGADPLQSIMLADAKLYMTEDVLVKVDRMSMAHGLEVRCPFLSKSLVDYAFSIPSRMKIQGERSKAVLRALAASLLPPENVRLPKRGFHVDLDGWFRGNLRDRFEDEVLRPGGGADSWLDRSALRRLWSEHQRGQFNHGMTLWALLVLATWSRKLARVHPRSDGYDRRYA